MHILIWLYDLFSLLDPIFDFAIYAVQVCVLFIPYPELRWKALLEIGRKEAIQCLGEESIHIERSERIIWGAKFYFDFKNLSKEPSYLAGRVWLIWFFKLVLKVDKAIGYEKTVSEKPRCYVYESIKQIEASALQNFEAWSIHTPKLGGLCWHRILVNPI